MSKLHGKFVWYDLMTTNAQAAAEFYEKVIGWTAADSGMTPPYTLLNMGASMVGGIMGMPPEAGHTPPTWTGHIGVDDVDAYAEKVTAAGGCVLRPPTNIPNVGRFSVVADPHGAAFILFKPNQEMTEPAGAPGQIGWRELHAGELEPAWEFYSSLFGWTAPGEVDMGPMGVYRMFATGGETPVGGMMTKMPETPAPMWLYYFTVEALDAAMERAASAGGKLVMGPHEVPGGQWIAQYLDPAGGDVRDSFVHEIEAAPKR